MSGFFSMGGYALYVWPAYGVTALAIAAIVLASLRARKVLRRELARFEAMAGEGEG